MQPSITRRLPERTHDAFVVPPGAVAARQAASAAQWLARFANSWLAAEPGNPQLLLGFDAAQGTLVTRPVVAGLALELRLADLSLQLLENGTPSPHRMELQDRTPAHVEAWLLVELLHRAVVRDRFSKALPWSTADLMNGDSEEFTPDSLGGELAAIGRAFALAGPVLAQMGGIEADGVRCSPDNFHTAVAIGAGPAAGPMLLAGVAPGDAITPEPYFYVARALPRPGRSAPPAVVLGLGEIERRQLGVDEIVAALRVAAAAAAGAKAAE